MRKLASEEAGYWRADRQGYGARAWLTQPSFWAVAIYRFGRWTIWAPRSIRSTSHLLYYICYSAVRLITGIDIPRQARFGPGLMIHHFGGVIVNPGVAVGARCVMRQGVTIGAKDDSGNPCLGDDVLIGAYAQILGPISIGNGAKIGAMAVVLSDVPPGATAVGNPARIVPASLSSHDRRPMSI